ncbi:hypothetical protein OAY91_00490 [Candidatus Pelagibacter sp.]|nr:hypothetical protein [Candidatus Pelagibacter sp.]
MKKFFVAIVLSIIFFLVIFHEKIFEKYVIYKLSNWVKKEISFDEFNFKYPNKIKIKGISIINSNPTYYDNIFESELISIDIDLKTYFLEDLVIINDLKIDKPIFYLELIVKKSKVDKNIDGTEKIIFNDNIGVAKKISENLPDKVWPLKKRDINFLILKSSIYNGKTFINISSIKEPSFISLSNFEFSKIGNQKGFQHYKDVLKIIFFDIFGRESDPIKKKILQDAYKLN